MLKKITMFLMSMLITTSAMADRIEFIPTSTLGGPHGTVIRLITEIAKPAGFDFAPTLKNGCGEAVSTFNNAKGPIAITWSDTMYKNGARTKQNCEVNFKESVAIAVYDAPYEVCTLPGVELKKNNTYTLGNNQFNPRVTHLKLMNSNKQGIKFKDVIYPSSGKVLQGLINKEIDVGYIATGNALSAIKAGSIKCLYTTGATKYGQKPLSDFTGKKEPNLSEWRLGILVFVRNFTPEQLSALKDALKKGNLVSRLEASDMVNVSTTVSKSDIEDFKKKAKAKINID